MGRASFCHCTYGQFYLRKVAILHGPKYIAPVAVELIYAGIALATPVLKCLFGQG